MRLTLILLITSTLNIFALGSYSQNTKISLDLKSVTVKEALNAIENSSEFFFIYNNDLIDVNRKVDINVKNEKISEVLDNIFAGQKVDVTVVDRKIVLAPASMSQPNGQSVSGKVTDEKGVPLPGVTVVIKGTTTGVITDNEGKFTFSKIEKNSVLEFSFIGMKTREIPVGGKTNIEVSLASQSIGLEDVVVVGYGTQTKKTLTGAISVIGNETLENRPSSKTTDLLQGISSGIQISRTNTGDIRGSQNDITIRGVTSRSAPGVLIVVDGIPQSNTDASALDNINPETIENISVLKDGQAAIYGARAAGGVILVTTKAGKTEKPTIQFSTYENIQSPSLLRKPNNILQIYEMQNEGFVNDGILTNPFTNLVKFVADNHITLADINKNDHKYLMSEPFDATNPYYLGNYDWNDIMFHPALEQNYNVSISGKSKNLNYFESVNYLDQDGMLAYGSNYKKRLLITLKNDYDVTKWLKIKSNFNIGSQKLVQPTNYSSNGWGFGVQGALWFTMPTLEPATQKGNIECIGGYSSPLAWAQNGGNTTDLSYILHGTLGAEIKPFKNMVIDAELSSDYDLKETDWAITGFDQYSAADNFIANVTNGQNSAGAEFQRTRYTVANVYAKYTYDKLTNQSIKLTAGYSHEENDFRDFSASRKFGLISPELPTMSLGSPDYQYNGEIKNDFSLSSLYSRLEYSYLNRYLLEGVFRYDGSSKFAEGHQWKPFSGVSGGWVVTDENFMKGLKNAIDFLKIRASWGQLGNQSGIGLYDYLSQVNIGGAYPMGNWSAPSRASIATLGTMPSATRTWETIESKDLGFDFMALKSRLTGSLDLYIKDNNNMFFNQEFPQVLGTTAPNINGANLRTNGWELEIGWKDKIKDFNYFVKFNLSDNTNKVVSLADNIIPMQGLNTFVQGYPAMSYFGYRYDGKIQSASELAAYNAKFSSGIPNNLQPGDARYKDLNGDGKLTPLPYAVDVNGKPTSTSGDLVQIGDGGLHYQYGITLGFSWKNFDFSSFFQGVLKQEVINADLIPDSEWYIPCESYFYHNTWAPDRTNALWPRLSQDWGVKINNYQYSDAPYKMFNNQYIRLKNLQLGYTLPKTFTSRLKIEKLRVYFSGTDLWEKSNLPGNQDPETPFTQFRSPFPRQYSLGLNLTL